MEKQTYLLVLHLNPVLRHKERDTKLQSEQLDIRGGELAVTKVNRGPGHVTGTGCVGGHQF